MVPPHSQGVPGPPLRGGIDSLNPKIYNGPAVIDYELIDHTADLGIIVRAPHLPGLFSGAAHALFDLTCDLRRVSSGTLLAFRLEDADLECLMVSWLNELIFLHETQRLLFNHFDVVISGNYHLEAQVHGEAFEAQRHLLFRSIKAATYHQLRVVQQRGLWTARIILDV